jgi:[ribosomal protein S5]-alanine N-acetyltransferase
VSAKCLSDFGDVALFLMTAEIETPRLVLRPPRLSDADALFSFLGDPAAMRFTQVRNSLRDCRRYLALHERRRAKNGCAPWVVQAKHDGKIVGFGGLYDDPFDPGWGVELAYFFAPSARGHGFATELGRASLDYADARGTWDSIAAFANPHNAPSQSVLRKLGFRHERFVPEMNRDLYRWRVENGHPSSSE